MSVQFKLRRWTMADLPDLVKHANNWSVAKNLTNRFPHPYSEKDGEAFIKMITAEDNPDHVFCIEMKGEAAGGIGIHPKTDIYRKNAEIGYWVAEPFWGKGIISQAIPQVVDLAFENLDIDRLYAPVFGSNLASQRVLEKSGFILEGRFEKTIFKKGRYEDEHVYALRRENWAGK